MNTLKIPCKPGEVSDGFHTFDELYDHRCTLFLALMSAHHDLSWMSVKHHDDSEWDGWFIAGMRLPTGDVTYHLPVTMLGLAQDTGCLLLDRGIEWDGHTDADVVTRIQDWIRVKKPGRKIEPDPVHHKKPKAEGPCHLCGAPNYACEHIPGVPF